MLLTVVTSLVIINYGTTTHPAASMPSLTDQEKTYINKLSINQSQIPAWLIAQLLDVSEQLNKLPAKMLMDLPEVQLNNLLADPGRFQAKMVTIKGYFVQSNDVQSELQLPASDHCWSVIVLDAHYRRPIQCFTIQNPNRFRKSSMVRVVGYYLTNRIDRSKSWMSSESLIIPVIIGAIVPIAEKSVSEPIFQEKKFIFKLLAVIIILGLTFLMLRMYIAKRFPKNKETLSGLKKGRLHEKGPSEPGG